MNSAAPVAVASDAWRLTGLLTTLARWFVGGMFIYLGLNKALHPVEFLKLVRQYDLVHQPLLLNFVAAALPWFEIFCGLLLLLGVAVRGAALISLSMLIPFTALVFSLARDIYLASGLPFCAIKFDCGCGAGEVFICPKLAENLLLTGLCVALIFRRKNFLCLRHAIAKA